MIDVLNFVIPAAFILWLLLNLEVTEELVYTPPFTDIDFDDVDWQVDAAQLSLDIFFDQMFNIYDRPAPAGVF
jgi:hypothetical protein